MPVAQDYYASEGCGDGGVVCPVAVRSEYEATNLAPR